MLRVVVAAVVLATCPLVPAHADSHGPGFGLSGRIGASVATVPTYEGSPDDRVLAGPDLTLIYRSHDWGTLEFSPRGLTWSTVEAGRFRFALVAQFDLGRRDGDTSTLNPTPGDGRLAGMGRVSSSAEVGVGVGYGPVMLVARQALSERGLSRAQVDLSADIPWSLSERFSLYFALGATWANRGYMQTYFGVTPAQERATSFSAYTPKSECRKVEASVGVEYALAPRWKLLGSVGVTQLGDVAASSPLVARRTAASAAFGAAYEF